MIESTCSDSLIGISTGGLAADQKQLAGLIRGKRQTAVLSLQPVQEITGANCIEPRR
jgi:hypothetical protein